MFRFSWFTFAKDFGRPKMKNTRPSKLERASRQAIENTVLPLRVRAVGIDTVYDTNDGMERFNSALFVDRTGEPIGRYDKMHLVMFGEYVPFAKRFPFLSNSRRSAAA